MPKRWEAAVVAAALLVFLFFAAAWIHLPGPQEDELLPARVILPALRPTALYSLNVASHRVPLMLMSYLGTLKGWLLSLWFLAAPMSMPGYRAFGICAGLAALWLVYWFARRYWGRTVSLLLVVLLATDPSFVHTIRLDYGPVALMHLLKMGGLCLLARWLSGGSRAAMTGGMFLLGLGLWDKASFIWFLAGLAATVGLLFPREALRRFRAAPLALAALLVGAAPLLAYNLTHRGQTWRERGQLEIRWSKLRQAEGTFNGDFLSALTGEDLLDASPAAHDIVLPSLAHVMYRLGRLRQTIILPLLAVAVLLLPMNLWIGRRRALLFPLLLSLFTYTLMFVSFDGGASVHHVIMLQPFPLLFLAASLWTPAERWPRRVIRSAALAAVGAAVLVNFALHARHLAIYTRTGGSGRFTDAAYRLAPYLAQHAERKLYAIDWGIANPMMFLGARWNLLVDEIFFSLNAPGSPDPRAVERLAELMRDPRNLFLLHSPQRTIFPAPAAIFYSLAGGGIRMHRVASFQERSGETVYEIYQYAGEP